jgi:hypothetical protein
MKKWLLFSLVVGLFACHAYTPSLDECKAICAEHGMNSYYTDGCASTCTCQKVEAYGIQGEIQIK